MNDTLDIIDTVNGITDILLLSLILLQQITGKSREEVLQAIKDEGIKTDELLAKLR